MPGCIVLAETNRKKIRIKAGRAMKLEEGINERYNGINERYQRKGIKIDVLSTNRLILKQCLKRRKVT